MNIKLENCIESKTDVLNSSCGLECCALCMKGYYLKVPTGDCIKGVVELEGCLKGTIEEISATERLLKC